MNYRRWYSWIELWKSETGMERSKRFGAWCKNKFSSLRKTKFHKWVLKVYAKIDSCEFSLCPRKWIPAKPRNFANRPNPRKSLSGKISSMKIAKQ